MSVLRHCEPSSHTPTLRCKAEPLSAASTDFAARSRLGRLVVGYFRIGHSCESGGCELLAPGNVVSIGHLSVHDHLLSLPTVIGQRMASLHRFDLFTLEGLTAGSASPNG